MVSIVIPVYNEEAAIDRTLSSLPFAEGLEVIVVDGQSSDGTKAAVGRYPVKFMTSPRGRALQMNAGASAAGGDVLLFLHADCVIDHAGLKAIERQIANDFIGGCFTHKIGSPRRIYRWIEASGNMRAGLFKVFYGDQAIFVRRDIFEGMGGFPAVSIFEDVLFSKKLRRLGKTTVLNHEAVVLPRRWEKSGLFRTTILNWFLTIGFILGISTDRLAKLYRDIR